MADVVVEVHGTRARFTGLGAEALEAVRKATTYKLEGAFFAALARGLPYAAAAKAKDTATFLRWAPETRVHTLPTGLVGAALEAISGTDATVDVRDCRPQLPPRRDFGFESDLRRYQLEAVRDLTRAGGTGIFKHSVRSGKTRASARVIAAYGVPTVFVVTSQILLRQAQEVLSALLTRASVTCVGEGDRDVSGDVVVCTVQALLRARERKDRVWRAICHRSLIVIDEVHRLEKADRWVATVLQIAAPVRLGLSATVWPDDEVTQEDLFLRACTGDIVSEVSMAEVMSLGFLVPCTVRTREISEPDGSSLSYGPVMLDKMIYDNKARNAAIVEEVTRAHEEGYRGIVITTNRVAHAERLKDQLEAAHMNAKHLVGAHADSARQGVLELLRKRQIDCVVSTVLSEGVDIPECSVVVAGEGGRSRRAALQRMRCLTPAEGKERALFVDFVDSANPSTADHSASRIGAYEDEGCFDMERVS